MKVWDRARIELVTPGSAVRLASVAKHVTDCAMWPLFLSVIAIAMFKYLLGRLASFAFPSLLISLVMMPHS